jgi:hypothetical protein
MSGIFIKCCPHFEVRKAAILIYSTYRVIQQKSHFFGRWEYRWLWVRNLVRTCVHFWMVTEIFPGLLEDVPLPTRTGMSLQHGGAPYISCVVIQLNNTFPDRWISSGGPNWPPRSPDLTPLDYFFVRADKEPGLRKKGEYTNALLARFLDAAARIKECVRQHAIFTSEM